MIFEWIICGLIPLKVKSFKENKNFISVFNAFAGGLFLSIGLMHIMPEANESFGDYFVNFKGDDSEKFPWAFFIVILSISLILFIEKVFVFKIMKK